MDVHISHATNAQAKKAEALNWATETLRSGVAMDVASDDLGTLGVPGTWHRVRRGSAVLLTTRNRGDALRRFQRTVLQHVGECGPQNIPLTGSGGTAYINCLLPKGHDGDHTP